MHFEFDILYSSRNFLHFAVLGAQDNLYKRDLRDLCDKFTPQGFTRQGFTLKKLQGE